MLPITIRKKSIDKDTLETIQATILIHWDKGRKHISKVLCQQWNWRQPNGQLKDMACREVLLTLERKGLITLPARLTSAHNVIATGLTGLTRTLRPTYLISSFMKKISV